MIEQDTYRTIDKFSTVVIYKDKGSKFLAYAYPLQREDQVKEIVGLLKKEHYKARHWCYAWQLGVKTVKYRVNDDGEPTNSAGQPIYGQILSKELTNILVVVVRYFGGTKLGVGGLVNAYKNAALMALESSLIITKTIDVNFKLIFEYKNINKVMCIIREKKATIISQKMEFNCKLYISIRNRDASKLKSIFEALKGVKIVDA